MSADAALVALGSRWELVIAEWSGGTRTDEESNAIGERESALFAQIMALPAAGATGLAVKARVLAHAMDCYDYSLAGIVAAAAARQDKADRAALSLAADVLQLERETASRDPVLAALAVAEGQENGADAILLALRRPRVLAEMELAAAFAAIEAKGAVGTDPRSNAAFAGKTAIAACIFATPARTLEGVLFKREVLEDWIGCEEEDGFRAAMEADLLAMVESRKHAASHAEAA